jgi:hypothetical protein
MSEASEAESNFHLIEYKALRAELVESLHQMDGLYKFFFFSLFATMAWIVTYSSKLDIFLASIGAWIPFLITHYFAQYRKDRSDSIHRLGAYLLALEQKYADEHLGWEKSIRRGDRPIKIYRRTSNTFMLSRLITFGFAVYMMLSRGGVFASAVDFGRHAIGPLFAR